MWVWLIPLLALVVATAIVVPIALSGGDEASGSGDTAAPAETSMPEETRTPKPEDRDPAAVTVALRRLDPCKLFDLAVARKRQRPNVVTIPSGPHSCFLAPDADYTGGGGGIELSVGTLSDQFFRYDGAPFALAGAKAYEYSSIGDSGSSCRVVIPVSSDRAIELYYMELGEADLCPTVRQYAAGTVGKLRNPDALANTDTSRPFSAWDGCSLLRTALGATAGDYVYEPHSHGDHFGGCNAANKDRANGYHPANIQVSYDDTAEVTGKTRTIGGKTVAVTDRSKDCSAHWDHGPTGVANKLWAVTPVAMSAKDCDTLVALVEKVIALAGTKPADDAAPQRPLLYGPDENDTASKGACVDLAISGGVADCEPYQEVPVPRGTDAIMAASEVNRNLQCAVFADAVADKFGAEFVPVTWEAHGFFVDSAHTVRIQVNVDDGNAPADYGRGDLYADREKIEIAGKPAIVFWDADRTVFEIYLSPHDATSERGNLHIAVEMVGGRGKEFETPPSLPRDKADLATEVMEQVVETYFR
ncbi:hypothetical protein JCM33774_75980 [Actinophytocola sp. KF-1]